MLKKLLATAAVAATCIGAPAIAAPTATPAAVADGAYPNYALKWQIRILAAPGWRPFAYYFCQDATGDKVVWLRQRHYHYFVVERCIYDGYGHYRSTIRYWYVY